MSNAAPFLAAGPWSRDALRVRALRDLKTIASAMHDRQIDGYQISNVLLRQACLWNQIGADLPAGTPMTVLRQLPGLANYDPLAEWEERVRADAPDSLAEGIDPGGTEEVREWKRRAFSLAEWLRANAGTPDAEAAVRAVERDLCEFLLESDLRSEEGEQWQR